MKQTAVNTMREHAAKQYDRLLTEYDTFQIDDEYMDCMIAELVPTDIRYSIAEDQGKSIWGLHPIIQSDRVTEAMLKNIIGHLDAIAEWCNAGNELDYYCVYDEATGKIRYTGDNEDWYSDGAGNIVYISE